MTSSQLIYEYIQTYRSWIGQAQGVAALLGLLIIMIVVFTIPFFPLLMSKLRGRKPVCLVMTKGRNMRLNGGLRLRNSMYATHNELEYFVKKHAGHLHFLGTPVDIIHADTTFVQHPVYNNFIRMLRRSGYPRWKDLATAIRFSKLDEKDPKDVEIIQNLGFESKAELQAKYNPLNLSSTSKVYDIRFGTCALDELNSYGAKVPPAGVGGQISDDILSQESPVVLGFFQQFGKLIILAVIILMGGGLSFTIISSVK